MKQTRDQRKSLKLNSHDKVVLSAYAQSSMVVNFHLTQEATPFEKSLTYKKQQDAIKGF